jgi:hypothetical protein
LGGPEPVGNPRKSFSLEKIFQFLDFFFERGASTPQKEAFFERGLDRKAVFVSQ